MVVQLQNVTHHLVPHYKKVNKENVAGVMKCKYCNKGAKELPIDPTQHVCREAVNQSGELLKTPGEWEKIEGVHILDGDGWPINRVFEGWPPVSWETPIPREEFVTRMSASTCEFLTKR